MKRIPYLLVLLFLVVQYSFAQDKHSRIKITNPSQQTINTIASQGIDLSCGSKHDGEDLIIEVSETEINSLIQNNVSFTIEIDDLTQFYSKRAERDLPIARAQLNAAKASALANTAERSISNVVMDNIIQYAECDEIDFVEPQNFNLGSMSGCLTFQEMKDELDDMYTYSQTNSLDIVSQKANASSTGQKTWGNPTNNFVNQQNNGPATYSGVGSTRWNPETIWYVRITGNQSTTAEGSKPQMLFTSMIHSREVSALMNNIYFMWYIIENYGSDPAITELVDNNELYFVPVVNPDGLRWNETISPGGGGLQRKNLRPNTGGTGTNRGVDLNRNFDYFWGYNNIGSSGTQTASNYRGPAPESEPETQIMVDFITSRNIKSAVWNHSFANSVPHPYGGIPTQSTGREDEYYKWHEEMTRYNRYLYGATIFYESNGLPDDWMMGGAPDNNGATGSGQAIIATTPEHGGQGFWPTPSTIVPIAKQSMRISLGTAYYGGKYAKLHDLTQSNVTSLTADLDFGIERIGQTASDFTVTVTPISANIASIVSPATETGIVVLDQRTVTATLNLNPSIGDNEKIEYNVTLSNDDGIIYEANYEKYYQPTATVTPLFAHDPDASGLTGWTQSGGWTTTTSDAYSGTTSINTGTYSNNATKTLTTTNSFDFSNSNEVLIQFYTKWDIERNYDFVEVLGSPDGGTNWISLCGNYTKPNATSATTTHDNKSSAYANFQNNSAGQVYDGDQLDNWVMEEITIDGAYASLLNSNNVRIRFNFRTDALNVNENYTTTNDGFFIDDFKIISVQVPCQTTVPTNLIVTNTTTLTAQIDWDAVPSATYDIRYRETGSGPTGWTTITDLATNSYLITGLTQSTDYDVQVRTRCVTSTSAYTTITTFTTAAPVPCTGNSVSSYPYSEDFETNIGLWSQTNDDDIDWTRDNAGTPSANTGPSTGDGDTFYMYTEASGAAGFPSKVANFVSPCFDLTGKDNIQFTYSYHMFGQFIGSLRLQVSTDNGASYQTLDEYDVDLGDTWNQKTTDLSAYKDQVIKLRFNAITGSDPTSGWNSDIAIDNINVTADDAGSAPPSAVCQNITVQLDNSGNATIVATDVDGGSTDDVAITNYSIDINTFDCSNIGTPVDVTLTVTDGDAQTDTCIASVTVVDQVDPEFVNVPGDIDLTCGNNQPTWTDPTATDNCDTTLTVIRTDGTGLNSGDTFPTGTTIISYSVTDDSGNSNTASFNVNVIVDNQNPTAVCQNISVQLDAGGNASITAGDINNGSSDNCGIASLSASQTAFTCADEGANNVTLTVKDTNGNQDSCIAVVTITLQDAPTGLECWETATYNYTTCQWDITGTQPAEPTTECWETATFDTDDTSPTYCTWVITGTQPAEPTTECWETATFDSDDTSPTYCTWVITGTQPAEPTATNCWDDYQFNTTLCTWENQGTEPAEPTTECWETAAFDGDDTSPTYCTWIITGTQPAEPTTECWETATFDSDDTSPTYCTWVITGTQPTEPTATNCWDDYQFNTTLCAWENQGAQPAEPTTECWETATFDNDDTSPTYCTWVVTGTQPIEPIATNCWDNYQFNTTLCTWENQGTEPVEPTTECWETATFDSDDTSPTYCTWVVTGTQPAEPTTECWETATFDNDDTSPTYCSWVVTGTQPAEPTTECWETATFDNDDTSPTYCTWVITGTQPAEPTTECWETATFDNDDTSPTYCTWVVTGTQPAEPTTECWETATFDNDDTSPTYCTWVVTGTQPAEPTTECWETATFDNDGTSPTYCTWVVSGTQPTEPTATNCWDDYQFNTTTCAWENQGSEPTPPSGLVAVSITDTQATINWDATLGLDYDLRYREVGSSVWIDILDVLTNSQTLTSLTPLTQYVVQVRSKCSNESASVYSTAIDFTTLDTVLNYCGSASNNAGEEYIGRVQLNTIDNISGSQTYSDFTSISTSLTEGEQYTISITPIWTGTVYNEAYSVWIDYNRDGDFEDAGEQVFTQGNTQATLISGSFTIPTGTSRQKTRMRVSMKYNALPTPCEAFAFGEVEDYSVTLYGSDDLIYSNSAWIPYGPSPTTVTENAIILDGTYTVTDDVQINNIRVSDGAGIVIEKSKSITVNGDLVTSDNVILESDSDEYSSLIVNNIVIGKAKYKRHVNTTASVGGNDLIAPPVYGESFIDFRAANPNILSNSASTLFLFGPFDKVTDTYVIYSDTETATLNAGTGYRAASTDDSTFTFNGLVETENVRVPIVNDGPTNPEWNLVGNPYTSYIKLSDFLQANSSQFTIQSAGIYGYDGYASDGWTIWNQAYSDANPNAIITPGQGFLIASATNNGQIDFTPEMRRIGNADDFILGRNTDIKHLQLQLENPIQGTYKTDFYFTDNASNGMDFNYDASIYGEQAPSGFALYSQLLEENSGIDMAIQSLGFDALSGAVIPLGIHFPQGQQIALSISESDLHENVEVYLEDTLNNTFTLLNNSDYIITPNENLNTIGRYYLRFNEETLSTNTSTVDDLKIYTSTQPKVLYVKGQLLQNSKLSIYDLQGRLIKKIRLNNSQNIHRIDITHISSGSYIVSLENDFQKKTQKVIIK